MTTLPAIKARVRAGERKPTVGQRGVLEAMRDGADLRSDATDWYFEGDRNVNGTTAKSLHLAGWVRCYWRTGDLRKYELTTLGRAALTPEP